MSGAGPVSPRWETPPPSPPGVKCDAEPVDGREGRPAAAVSQLQNLGNGLFFTANPEEPTSGALAVNSLRLRPAKVHFWKFHRRESERWLAGKTWPFDATPLRRLEVRKTVAAGRRGRGRGGGRGGGASPEAETAALRLLVAPPINKWDYR